MDIIQCLQGKTIGIDTAPLIYFIEEHHDYIHKIEKFFFGMDNGDFFVVTSTITLLEVLIHPLRQNNSIIASEYKEILLNSNLRTIEITNDIAISAAKLRASYNIRTPDALQISAALSAKATFFFTNDSRLPQLPSINYITPDNFSS